MRARVRQRLHRVAALDAILHALLVAERLLLLPLRLRQLRTLDRVACCLERVARLQNLGRLIAEVEVVAVARVIDAGSYFDTGSLSTGGGKTSTKSSGLPISAPPSYWIRYL